MALWEVTIMVEVQEPVDLWRKAVERMAVEAPKAKAPDVAAVLGTSAQPNVKACLIMLLDRSDNLDGAEIEETTAEEVEI